MARAAAAEKRQPEPAPPEHAIALPVACSVARLLEQMDEVQHGLIYVARSERRAQLLARLLAGFAPSLEVIPFPAWDCAPYDRAPPSRDAMGRRISALRRLAQKPPGPWVLIATPEGLAQRVAPRGVLQETEFRLRNGEAFSPDALQSFLLRAGYRLDERVDEAGEAAIRGAVIDVFPAGSGQPFRIEHIEGAVTGIRCYDAVSQRTLVEEAELLLPPASEVVLSPAGRGEDQVERFAGMEHHLPNFYDEVETVFDYARGARLVLDPGAAEAHQEFWAQVVDAHETRRAAPRSTEGPAPLLPERLYLDPAEWRRQLDRLELLELPLDGMQALPPFAEESEPGEALARFLADPSKDYRVVLAAGSPRVRRRLARPVRAALKPEPDPVADWTGVLAAPPGSVLSLAADPDRGFLDAERRVALIGAADLPGARGAAADEERSTRAELGIGDVELRPGDVVVHIEHGLARLKGIETLAPEGEAAEDAVVLEFADQAKLLVPTEELGKIWRYGGDADAVSLDRLGGATWPKRRAALEADLAEMAGRLVALAKEKEQAEAEKIIPPRRAYERFAAGFRYAETADQARAIEGVLTDLASGRPMDRLVCGDVGFGKTEVALRAAAAAALSGKQVAIAAPTTVLVRQHVQTFRRRFAGFGIEVGHLSRLVKPAEARAVKQALASGDMEIVVGTHALAGKGVKFEDLGLLVIDEEQRFGAKQKDKLRALGRGAHVLTLTATPIPRTLEQAMIGLQDVSVIATPPARRQPVRTFLTPFDPVSVRSALLRERARGGQSFVVCPRIEDIAPMAERLGEPVPELQVVIAHGKMPADEIDAAMVDFAEGVGDVLLATNIIESGLDVPRANTILIWRADRFGLSQLHQLRGRVGRGRARGVAYLLTDPAAKIGKATEQRLRTLEALDRLGAGFAISGRDLDHRGAGDLLGDEQAGHVRLIGMGLYQHLLQRALAAARGEAVKEDWTPVVRLGIEASVPEDYVPEPEIRINLHGRLARLAAEDEPEALAEEIADRFGPLPAPVENLIAIAAFRRRARELNVEKLDAGPEAIAATFRPRAAPAAPRRAEENSLKWRGDWLVWARRSETARERRQLAAAFLDRIARTDAPPRANNRERETAVAH